MTAWSLLALLVLARAVWLVREGFWPARPVDDDETRDLVSLESSCTVSDDEGW